MQHVLMTLFDCIAIRSWDINSFLGCAVQFIVSWDIIGLILTRFGVFISSTCFIKWKK